MKTIVKNFNYASEDTSSPGERETDTWSTCIFESNFPQENFPLMHYFTSDSLPHRTTCQAALIVISLGLITFCLLKPCTEPARIVRAQRQPIQRDADLQKKTNAVDGKMKTKKTVIQPVSQSLKFKHDCNWAVPISVPSNWISLSDIKLNREFLLLRPLFCNNENLNALLLFQDYFCALNKN